jgi:hypothetical protein
MEQSLEFDYTFTLTDDEGNVLEGGGHMELDIEMEDDDKLDIFDSYMIAIESVLEQLHEGEEGMDLDTLPDVSVSIEGLTID